MTKFTITCRGAAMKEGTNLPEIKIQTLEKRTQPADNSLIKNRPKGGVTPPRLGGGGLGKKKTVMISATNISRKEEARSGV